MSLQSCPTLCDPIDRSPPGSPVPGILQARTLERVAISFSSAWKWKVKGEKWLLATAWTTAYQAPLSMGLSRQEYWSGVPLPSLQVCSCITQTLPPVTWPSSFRTYRRYKMCQKVGHNCLRMVGLREVFFCTSSHRVHLCVLCLCVFPLLIQTQDILQLGPTLIHSRGFPDGSDGKESACNAGDPGLIPRSGRASGEGNGYSLQYSCLENSVDRGAWGTTIPGVTKSQIQLSN